jgi:kinesin family protein 6/9
MVMQEDDINNIRFKNINVVNISNEQEGLDLLMMGNFIR